MRNSIKTFPYLRTWVLALRSAYPDLDQLADEIVQAAGNLKNTTDLDEQALIVSHVGDRIVEELSQMAQFFPPVTALPPFKNAMQAGNFWASQPETWLASTAGKPGVIMMAGSNVIMELISAMAGANMKLAQDASSLIDGALAPVIAISEKWKPGDFNSSDIKKLRETWNFLTNRFNFGDVNKYPKLAPIIAKITGAMERLNDLNSRNWQYYDEVYASWKPRGYDRTQLRRYQSMINKAQNDDIRTMLTLMRQVVRAILDLKTKIEKYEYDLTGANENSEIGTDVVPEFQEGGEDPDIDQALDIIDAERDQEFEDAGLDEEAKSFKAYIDSVRPYGIRSGRVTAKLFLLAYRAYKSDLYPKMIGELVQIKREILDTAETMTGQDWEKKYGNWVKKYYSHWDAQEDGKEPDPEWVEVRDTYDLAKHIRDILGYNFWDIMGNDFKEHGLEDAKTALESANLAIMQGIATYKKGIILFDYTGQPADSERNLQIMGEKLSKEGLGPAADAIDAAINTLKSNYDPTTNNAGDEGSNYGDPRDDKRNTGRENSRGQTIYEDAPFGTGDSLRDKGRAPNRRSLSVPVSVRKYITPSLDLDL